MTWSSLGTSGVLRSHDGERQLGQVLSVGDALHVDGPHEGHSIDSTLGARPGRTRTAQVGENAGGAEGVDAVGEQRQWADVASVDVCATTEGAVDAAVSLGDLLLAHRSPVKVSVGKAGIARRHVEGGGGGRGGCLWLEAEVAGG